MLMRRGAAVMRHLSEYLASLQRAVQGGTPVRWHALLPARDVEQRVITQPACTVSSYMIASPVLLKPRGACFGSVVMLNIYEHTQEKD